MRLFRIVLIISSLFFDSFPNHVVDDDDDDDADEFDVPDDYISPPADVDEDEEPTPSPAPGL